MSDEDDYAEIVAEYIIMYLLNQQAVGREIVYESEIWQMLGQPFPKNRYDQPFLVNDFTQVKLSDNIISLEDRRKKLN